MTFKTEKAKQRAVRKAYRAMDALQNVIDCGVVNGNTARAQQAVREVIREIERAEIHALCSKKW
jgi:hypothetical protein